LWEYRVTADAAETSHRSRLSLALGIGSAALLLILVTLCGLLVEQTYRVDATGRALGRTSAIRAGIQQVFALLEDAETAQRGYLLTGKPLYLVPYNAAARRLGAEIGTLGALLKDDPHQHAQIVALQGVARRKMAELTQTIDLNRRGRRDAAIAMVRSDQGLALMGQARHILDGVQAIQTRERATNLARRDIELNRTVWTVASLIVVLCLAIVFIATMAYFHLRARDRIIADVRHLTGELGKEKAMLVETVHELDAARKSADAANHAKSEFLASVSHELRTPLNAILGFSEIIRDELFGPVGVPQYADYANDVHRSGSHLLDLINDILDLSKIDAGKVELREETVPLDWLIGECVALVRERAYTGGVNLTLEAGPPGAAVFADQRLLKQILLNLLSNAIKFTPEGGSVTARIVQDGTRIGFRVADTGIGMSPAEIAKALSPYGQVDSKISRKHQGTGLGLPISHSLAQLHGGDLVVASKPGAGTTVTLLLPLSRARTMPGRAVA
jgi:signal transduction histidine kinase